VQSQICKPYKEHSAQESIPSLAGPCDNPTWSASPPGYIGWRNQFLGSLNVYEFGLCLVYINAFIVWIQVNVFNMYISKNVPNLYNKKFWQFFYLGKVGRKIAVTWRRHNSLQIRFISVPIYTKILIFNPFPTKFVFVRQFLSRIFLSDSQIYDVVVTRKGSRSEQSFLRVLLSVFFVYLEKAKG
jgi:hypothetical protein